MDEKAKTEKVVDARNEICPGPFWELIKEYLTADEGVTITLKATEAYDSDTKKDAPYWIKKSGNKLIGVYDKDGYYEVSMEKTIRR